MEQTEKKKLLQSLIYPGGLLAILWAIKTAEILLKIDFSEFGIYPQHFEGLRGILFAPLLHSNLAHLSANSVPLFVLLAGLFYFYDKLAFRILGLLWVMTGLWVWVFAKDTGIHIGASGVVYALAAFHFTGGLLHREPRMMAFSLLVVFLYGGLIWGIIPNFLPEKNISWESHLLGLLAGGILAPFYRTDGPQRKEYVWDVDEGDDDEEPDQEPPALSVTADQDENGNAPEIYSNRDAPLKIVYHLRKDDSEEQS